MRYQHRGPQLRARGYRNSNHERELEGQGTYLRCPPPASKNASKQATYRMDNRLHSLRESPFFTTENTEKRRDFWFRLRISRLPAIFREISECNGPWIRTIPRSFPGFPVF